MGNVNQHPLYSLPPTDEHDGYLEESGKNFNDDKARKSNDLKAKNSSLLLNKPTFYVKVIVYSDMICVNIPCKFTTNGWVLREALKIYRQQTHHETTELISIKRDNDEIVDLSAWTIGYLRNRELVKASSNTEGYWESSLVTACLNIPDQRRQSQIEFEVVVSVGLSKEYSFILPNLNVTCGWLLSETIRRYMAEHNDQDPGILGLRRRNGENLDLSSDVPLVLNHQEVVEAVSFTLNPYRSKRNKQLHNNFLVKFSSTSGLKTLKKLGHVDEYKPVQTILDEIELREAKNRNHMKDCRFRKSDRPALSFRYPVETIKDPSGLLPQHTYLLIDAVRLVVIETCNEDVICSWKLEDITRWVVGNDSITIKLMKPWGCQEYEFRCSNPSFISKSLLKRTYDIVLHRNYRSKQAIAQNQVIANRGLQKVFYEDSRHESMREFRIVRKIDPSGLLAKHLVLSFTSFQVNIKDLVTQDIMVEWPYIMIHAWGITESLLVVAVSGKVNQANSSKGIECHDSFTTFAFTINRSERKVIRETMKVMNLILENKEVITSKKEMQEMDMKNALWDKLTTPNTEKKILLPLQSQSNYDSEDEYSIDHTQSNTHHFFYSSSDEETSGEEM